MPILTLTESVLIRWLSGYSFVPNLVWFRFFPRCMECQRGLAMRKVSVRLSDRPSVCQTRAL